MPNRCEMVHNLNHGCDLFLANVVNLKKGFTFVSRGTLGLGVLAGFGPAFPSKRFRTCQTLTCRNRRDERTEKGD
jgi:hypothetical protein